jgi:hypothetical protein
MRAAEARRDHPTMEALEECTLLSLMPTSISVTGSSSALTDGRVETLRATHIAPGGLSAPDIQLLRHD